MTDHHDWYDGHDDEPYQLDLPEVEHPQPEHPGFDPPDLDVPWHPHEDLPAEPWHDEHVPPPDEEHHGPVTAGEQVAADPDATADTGTPDVFPPALTVGDLPEPVDGFPWIDTGSLGVVPAAADPVEPADPAGLAEYAAVDLPPAADPWAVLAADEDPATSALARWWSGNGG